MFSSHECFYCKKFLSHMWVVGQDDDMAPTYVNLNMNAAGNAPSIMVSCHAMCSPYRQQPATATGRELDQMVKDALKVAPTPYWSRRIQEAVEALKTACSETFERVGELEAENGVRDTD